MTQDVTTQPTESVKSAIEYIELTMEQSAEYQSQYYLQRFGRLDSRGYWKERALSAEGKLAATEAEQ